MDLIETTERLVKALARQRFAEPVTHVYNPLVYARAPWEAYLERFGRLPGRVILLGMNPGPWGMAQTGVPFGEVASVRDWLGLERRVEKPKREHPKRPVLGFGCRRSEVSGARLWGWARDRFGTPDRFFAKFFVLNYCPLVFMEEGGRNRTPDKLPASECAKLYRACDDALRASVASLQPSRVIGVGAFAEARANAALANTGLPIGRVLHPSPASPAANRGWAEQVDRELAAMGVA